MANAIAAGIPHVRRPPPGRSARRRSPEWLPWPSRPARSPFRSRTLLCWLPAPGAAAAPNAVPHCATRRNPANRVSTAVREATSPRSWPPTPSASANSHSRAAGPRGHLGECVPEIILVVVAYHSAVGRLGELEFQHTHTAGERCGDHRCPPAGLARAHKVDPAVARPHRRDSQSQQRFHLSAVSQKGTDQIERHARQVRQKPEHGNEQMAYGAELRMPVVSHHTDDAAQPIQQEGAEIRRQVTVSSELGMAAIPSCVVYPKLDQKPCGSDLMAASAGAPASPNAIITPRQPTTAEIVGQRPDGPVRSEILGMQQAEVLGHLRSPYPWRK